MSQAALFEADQTLGVGELVARVTKVVTAAFPAEIWVRGEVHGLKQPNSSGHVYFELCERNNRRGPTSTLNVALFRLEHQRVLKALRDYPDFRLADGHRPGAGVAEAHRRLRSRVAHLETDRDPGPDIEAATDLVRGGAFLDLLPAASQGR